MRIDFNIGIRYANHTSKDRSQESNQYYVGARRLGIRH